MLVIRIGNDVHCDQTNRNTQTGWKGDNPRGCLLELKKRDKRFDNTRGRGLGTEQQEENQRYLLVTIVYGREKAALIYKELQLITIF